MDSRREFLKKAATVGWATPLILTLQASAAHAQPSPTLCAMPNNRPQFCPCDTSDQCADNLCCYFGVFCRGGAQPPENCT
jgi:hypothetical protein